MKYTVAVIGTGFMGKQHLEVWNRLGVRIVICSADEATGETLAGQYGTPFYTDCTEMLEREKPDAVSVCLPTPFHFEAAKAALSRGIAVLCEKPFTHTIEEARELCRISEQSGVLLMVGHPLRFSRAYVYLGHCIGDRRFGTLKQLYLYRHSECPAWSVGSWLMNPEKSGGAVKDMHIHETDIVNYLLGMPESVLTVGDFLASTTVYRYRESSAAITAATSWRDAPSYPFTAGFDAVFENAAVELTGSELKLYTGGSVTDPLEAEKLPDHCREESVLANEIAYFFKCLQTGEKPTVCMPAETLDSMILNEAEINSLKRGCAVKI